MSCIKVARKSGVLHSHCMSARSRATTDHRIRETPSRTCHHEPMRHWTDADEATHQRILTCAHDAGLTADQLGELVPSWSQHAVLVDADEPLVLRVCHLGNTQRLIAESLLMRELPEAVGAPEVVRFGHTGSMTWAVSRRFEGWQAPGVQLAMSTLGYMVRQSLLWEPLADDSPPDHVVHLAERILTSQGW